MSQIRFQKAKEKFDQKIPQSLSYILLKIQLDIRLRTISSLELQFNIGIVQFILVYKVKNDILDNDIYNIDKNGYMMSMT